MEDPVDDTIPSQCSNPFDTEPTGFPWALDKDNQRIKKKSKIKGEALDNLLDALVWMRRKAKKRKHVDDLIDELISMRRKAKKKAAKRKGKRLTPRSLKPLTRLRRRS
jgi:hypothetical protein